MEDEEYIRLYSEKESTVESFSTPAPDGYMEELPDADEKRLVHELDLRLSDEEKAAAARAIIKEPLKTSGFQKLLTQSTPKAAVRTNQPAQHSTRQFISQSIAKPVLSMAAAKAAREELELAAKKEANACDSAANTPEVEPTEIQLGSGKNLTKGQHQPESLTKPVKEQQQAEPVVKPAQQQRFVSRSYDMSAIATPTGAKSTEAADRT